MIEKDSFVKIEYTAKIASTGEVFDTTNEADAKAAGLQMQGGYGPVVIAVGAGQVVPGLEEAIQTAEVGKQTTVQVPVEKAFGERKQELMMLVPLSKFQKAGYDPKPGMVMELDGRPAVIQSITSGRVRVDFNPPLAGQALTYTFKVTEVIKDSKGKVTALAAQLPAVKVDMQGTVAVVEVASSVALSENYIQRKATFLSSVIGLVKDVTSVRVTEQFDRPKSN